MNRQEMITEMERHAGELLEKMQEYRAIEQEYRLTNRALQVLKGGVKQEGGGARVRLYLAALAKHPDGVRPKEIYEELGIGAYSGIGTMFQRFEKQGYVKAQRSPGRKEVTYTVTKSGRDWLASSGSESQSEPASKSKSVTSTGSKATSAKLTGAQILKALAELPESTGKTKDVVTQLGRPPEFRNRVSSMLPYLKEKGLVNGKNGTYHLTAEGKRQVAETIVG